MSINFGLTNQVAVLEINRPDQLNALNQTVLEEMRNCLSELKQKPLSECRGLILSGAGEKAFIAGADIKGMNQMGPKEGELFGALGQEVTFLLEELPIPTIAAVHGFALGGGCEMALACDFILATDKALFGQPEVKLGLIPGFGGTQRLAKIIGRNKAKEIILTGRNVKAAEALELGLALKLYSTKDELLQASQEMIATMAQNSPLAVKIAKKVINQGVDQNNRGGLKLELDQFSLLFSSYDLKEGTQAFIEKRQANFKGE